MQSRLLTHLPIPSPAALAQSATLSKQVIDEIRAANHWMSFARFMEMCLYTPQLGYYTSAAIKFGISPQDGSDFVTAPGLSPLFGRALACQVAQIMQLSAPYIVEFGAGSGQLAADLLLQLEQLGSLPERYAILDLSADLQAMQRASLQQRAPHLLERVVWLDTLPRSIDGVVLANEVLDAMPVHLVVKHDGLWYERGVSVNDQQELHFVQQPLSADLHALLGELPDVDALPEAYVTELAIAARGFIASLAERLDQGALLLIDYGFPAHEFYHAQRTSGTLMAHYRHHAHSDALLWPGLQDLTAHVDFSALARVGVAQHLDLLGYTNQANFLINCGILNLITADPQDAQAWLPQTNALHKLLSEAEMGELFKVIALGRGLTPPLVGFEHGDRSQQL